MCGSLKEISRLTLKSMFKHSYEELPVYMLIYLKTLIIYNFLFSQLHITKILTILISLFGYEGSADMNIL
jgi:hypothetical protein